MHLPQKHYEQESCWQLEVDLPAEVVPTFMEAVEHEAASVSCFENQETLRWTLRLFAENQHVLQEMRQQIELLSEALGMPKPAIKTEKIAGRDWVSEIQKNFPPRTIGRFYVYASWHTDTVPFGLYPLQIDPGMAFGTGEHETTSGCLEAISLLSEQASFDNILDIGSGTGILAIACARAFPHATILASDIDPQAVHIATANCMRNHAQDKVRAVQAPGYGCNTIVARAPFDLIIANILANPLIQLAPELAANLAEGGVAILSGILDVQEADVLAAHTAHGMRLRQRIQHKSWVVLIIEKAT